MAEWVEVRFGEVTDNFDGQRIPVKEADRRPGPYPYYGASGVVDHIDAYLFDGEYLLIAEDGENLRTRNTPVAFLARGKFWVNNHAHIVRGNGNADTRFLMYALRKADVSAYLTGSTMPKLTQGNLNRIPIVLPPLREQRAIARVLGALDDKIELNRRMNETLEAMARALFKEWFVDGMSPSWRIGRVGDALALHRDSVDPQMAPEQAFAHYSIPAYDAGGMPSIELGSEIKSQKSRVPIDAVLISKLNPEIARVWLPAVRNGDNAVCSTEFMVAMPKPPFSSAFVYCLARSEAFRATLTGMVTGTSKSHQRVKPDAMLDMDMAVPNDDILIRFDRIVTPTLQRVQQARAESLTLAALRDTLLPKLISGELRVKDAEKIVEAAA
jgi:type I restriction enzyme S subunit